jgi:hypothetical protein
MDEIRDKRRTFDQYELEIPALPEFFELWDM